MTNPIPLLVNYLKASIEELRKVAWPNRRQTIHYSLLVVGISVALAAIIGILDLVFTTGIRALIDKVV